MRSQTVTSLDECPVKLDIAFHVITGYAVGHEQSDHSLTDEQRHHLQRLTRSGSAPARTQARARVLLLTDRSQGARRTDAQVAEAVLCSLGTVGNVRRRSTTGGLGVALEDRPRPGKAPKITGDIEAHLVTLCCSDPPEGEARWTLRLLASRLVELGLLDSLSHVAMGERLKKCAYPNKALSSGK